MRATMKSRKQNADRLLNKRLRRYFMFFDNFLSRTLSTFSVSPYNQSVFCIYYKPIF